LTAAVFQRGRLVVGHVGDSRLYLVRQGVLRQITRDDSLVEELLRRGSLSPEEARVHPQRHLLTNALGMTPRVQIQDLEEDVRPGDVFLLCTDGLTSLVEDHVLHQVLTEGPFDEAAWRLVALANRLGGHDNITVLVARFDEE
jgi:serine/threonine protein phosphatase PrpC